MIPKMFPKIKNEETVGLFFLRKSFKIALGLYFRFFFQLMISYKCLMQWFIIKRIQDFSEQVVKLPH